MAAHRCKDWSENNITKAQRRAADKAMDRHVEKRPLLRLRPEHLIRHREKATRMPSLVPLATIAIGGQPAVPVLDWAIEPPPVQYMRSLGAVRPDPNWSHVDAHGHEHRWVNTEREVVDRAVLLPTLTPSQEYVPCDGSCTLDDCEGYDNTVWYCSVCGDRVEPAWVPDYVARTTGRPVVVGPAGAWAEVEGRVDLPWAESHEIALTLPDGDVLTGKCTPSGVRCSSTEGVRTKLTMWFDRPLAEVGVWPVAADGR